MIYLSAPYSDNYPESLENKKLIDHYAMQLTLAGYEIYSPVTYREAIIQEAVKSDIEMGTDFEAWRKHCFAMLGLCKAVWVLQLKGWNFCDVVAEEMKMAELFKKRPVLRSEQDLENLLGLSGFMS